MWVSKRYQSGHIAAETDCALLKRTRSRMKKLKKTIWRWQCVIIKRKIEGKYLNYVYFANKYLIHIDFVHKFIVFFNPSYVPLPATDLFKKGLLLLYAANSYGTPLPMQVGDITRFPKIVNRVTSSRFVF